MPLRTPPCGQLRTPDREEPLKLGLRVGKALKLTIHGPEKLKFLQYRPVLDNTALKREFGYVPQKTSREAFEAYVTSHPDIVSRD